MMIKSMMGIVVLLAFCLSGCTTIYDAGGPYYAVIKDSTFTLYAQEELVKPEAQSPQITIADKKGREQKYFQIIAITRLDPNNYEVMESVRGDVPSRSSISTSEYVGHGRCDGWVTAKGHGWDDYRCCDVDTLMGKIKISIKDSQKNSLEMELPELPVQAMKDETAR